jgi:hypothetical protein
MRILTRLIIEYKEKIGMFLPKEVEQCITPSGMAGKAVLLIVLAVIILGRRL